MNNNNSGEQIMQETGMAPEVMHLDQINLNALKKKISSIIKGIKLDNTQGTGALAKVMHHDQIKLNAMKRKISTIIKGLEREIKVIKAEQGMNPNEDWYWGVDDGDMEAFSRGWARGAESAINGLEQLIK